jgi:hypothetical protein
MQLRILRSALTLTCLMGSAAYAAGPAQAAVLATTAKASAITPDSATLNGTIASGGAATPWQFQYGLASNPFASTYSPTQTVPAGTSGSTAVLAEVTGLIPDTTYTFNVIADPGTPGSTTTPLGFVAGVPLTFTTKKAGSASLSSTKLTVKGNRVSGAVKCASTIECSGTITITKREKSGKKLVACGSTSLNIEAGKKKKFRTAAVSKSCQALLSAAPGGVLSARLQELFSTGQKTISKGVTLTVAP